MQRLEFVADLYRTDQTERRTRAMADLLIQSGDFATDSVLILASSDFSGEMELRFAFTVTANPNGFVARALLSDGSDPAGVSALIRGTGVHVVVPGQIQAGSYVFQIESRGGTVAASSYSISARDPNEPDPGDLGPPEPRTTKPPLKVVKADEESAPGYDSQ
jgi:hypothetical protein